jgi:parvulin-like peptidyl-prolyl isomerase
MKPIRILIALALAATTVLGATACTNSDVAAKVNGEVISNEELQKQVDQLKKQYPQMFEGADAEGRLLDFKQRILDNLINQKLLEQAAKEKGIEVDDKSVSVQIEQLKAGFKDDAQFTAALQSAGMTEESLKTQVKEQLLTQKIVESLSSEASATAAEIKAYYDTNKTQFYQKEAKRASHILFKPEDKKKAEQVLKQIEDGGDFAALAKANSVDTASASKGGDLGWPTTPYVAEFEAALKKLKVGEVSGLVETPYGWHIITVTDERKGSQQKLDDVREQIAQILSQQTRADAYQKYLDSLRKKAKIEILVEELKLPAASKTTTSAP